MKQTTEKISDMIASIGYQCAYHAFPENLNKPIKPPFICFFYEESNDLYADAENYASIETLIIELYTREKDFDAERRVEQTLKKAGLTWAREETYLDDEKLYEVIYDTQVLISKEI